MLSAAEFILLRISHSPSGFWTRNRNNSLSMTSHNFMDGGVYLLTYRWLFKSCSQIPKGYALILLSEFKSFLFGNAWNVQVLLFRNYVVEKHFPFFGKFIRSFGKYYQSGCFELYFTARRAKETKPDRNLTAIVFNTIN